MFCRSLFRCCFYWVCILAIWPVLGVSTAFGECGTDDIQERLLQRAEAYLNFCDRNVISYAMVVRGLLYAGISPDHPFIRSNADVLRRLTPRNDTEAIRQREVALLLRVARSPNRPAPSTHEASTIQAAIVSDYCNDHYQRCGVIRLPQWFKRSRPNEVPTPERETGHLMAAATASLNLSRSSVVGKIPESNLSFVSCYPNDTARIGESDGRTGYILIAQTVRLRN